MQEQKANVIVDSEHQIEKGKFFYLSKRFIDIADNATINLRFKVPNNNNNVRYNVNLSIQSEGLAYIDIYSNSTYSNDGILQSFVNKNDESNYNSDANLYTGSIASQLGTHIAEEMILGGTGPKTVGGTSGQSIKTIVGKNIKDLLTIITNKSGQPKKISAIFTWYEEQAY